MLQFQYDYEDEDLDAYEDDFIDDAPIDDPYAKNYSKDIAKIFKYDKRKYQDMDDDDIEESTFSRCMAEEVCIEHYITTTIHIINQHILFSNIMLAI